MNIRITSKERNLIKGAIRRAFSRSDLRKSILRASWINHSDIERPRVTRWSSCAICEAPTPSYLIEVDHIDPVIPVNSSMAEMTFDELVNRTWCVETNLQAICPTCHDKKSNEERQLRNEHKAKKRLLTKVNKPPKLVTTHKKGKSK